MMQTSPKGIALIKQFEGFRSRAYRDVVGVWTIGWGFTGGVKEGDTITPEQAEKRLKTELRQYERAVWQATDGQVTQAQFDALVSFAYNVGIAGMQRSTVIRRHREGKYQAAARAFGLWNRAGGREVAGLTRRRAQEAALYLTPSALTADAQIPEGQPIEAERGMASSQINRAATVAGGTAAIATVADTARTAADIKTSADLLGTWLVPILLMVVVGLCIYIVVQRRKQREEGWA